MNKKMFFGPAGPSEVFFVDFLIFEKNWVILVEKF
jgi:hypothetical protein